VLINLFLEQPPGEKAHLNPGSIGLESNYRHLRAIFVLPEWAFSFRQYCPNLQEYYH